MALEAKSSPLTARRKLGAELRLLRDRAGLTTEEVGTHLKCNNSTVSRIELGKRTCTPKDFAALMELFQVTGTRRAELEALMRKGRQRVPPWWHAYNDVITANYNEFLAYEAEATRCSEYQMLAIPGLLQTEAYAEAVTARGYMALGPEQVECLVEVRLRRQARLREQDPLILEAVVSEAALRLRVGGADVMRGQLRKLRDIATLPNVDLRVIPFEAGEKSLSAGAFIMFATDQDAEADVAFTESAELTTVARDEALVTRRLSRLHRKVQAAALSPNDTLELIKRIESEMA